MCHSVGRVAGHLTARGQTVTPRPYKCLAARKFEQSFTMEEGLLLDVLIDAESNAHGD
jgi:hypothetical protein